MKPRTKATAALPLLAALALPAPAAAADAAALMAEACSTCHGAGLAGAPPIPGLTGLAPDDLTARMIALRDGTQAATVMNRLLRPLTDAELAALAAHIAALTGD